MFNPRPYLLKNKIQHYAWGMRGEKAFIPYLLGFEPEAGVPYAELWMGAHSKAPSTINVDGVDEPLDKMIEKFPQEILGKEAAEKYKGKLPFLFKVLSAGEALSIQAHPNKKQAEFLHTKDPLHYPDDNHKPEIAIALDSLKALVAFRPFAAIQQTLKQVPEISAFIGGDILKKFISYDKDEEGQKQTLLRNLFTRLMRRSMTHQLDLEKACQNLASRLQSTKKKLPERDVFFLELYKKYGGDVGLFSIYLLNLITLSSGEAVFLAAGVPHAYLRGNIIECMANSDNVVRAGLTPKFKDVETLVNILTYEAGPARVLVPDSEKIVYATPAQEFRVSRFMLQEGSATYLLKDGKVRILLLIEGKGTMKWGEEQLDFERGQSLLIPACLEEFKIEWQTPATLFIAES